MGARPSSFKVVEAPPVPVAPTRVWSPQQQEVFDWFQYEPASRKHDTPDEPPMNLVVRARAGTGKTTTIAHGVSLAPESRILVAAFNKGIQEELAARIQAPHVECKTLHALGMNMIIRQWGGRLRVDALKRGDQLTGAAVKDWETANRQKVPFQIARLITQLHTKGREMLPLTATESGLEALAYRFDLTPDENWGQFTTGFVASMAMRAMNVASIEMPLIAVGIDYADMLYLPLVYNLAAKDYELVVIDEAQDMTMAQLELAQRCCSGRICVVGDDRQAIYGFRGADSGSLDRLKEALSAAELPLTTTYRCAQSIVRRAQGLVPDIRAGVGNPEGEIRSCGLADVLTGASEGDFILSRLNAPIVALTLKLLVRGKRAVMRGRDIGAGLQAIVKKLKVFGYTPLSDVATRVANWETKMVTKLAASGQQDQIARIRDQAAAIFAFVEDANDTPDMLNKMATLFLEDKADASSYILLSTVHKAKGLEADKVWLLQDTLYRFGTTPEEVNIHYVAITRAKTTLMIVEGN